MLIAFPAMVMAVDENLHYRNYGNRTCTEWGQAREKRNIEYIAILNWISGYLTSYNAWQKDVYSITGENDLENIYLWIDTYCKVNPSKSLVDGLSDLTLKFWPIRTEDAPDNQWRSE